MSTANFRIIFPHIAKTGGTTLLFHFRQALGDEAVFVFGPHARVTRFLTGKPQFEELTPEARDRIRIVQGHGVDEDTLLALGSRPDDRLLVVLRNPVSFVRSRYNHRANAVARKVGRDLTPERFLKREDSDDATSRQLVRRFSSFVDPAAPDLAAQARSVLRHFHYVLTTEKMEAQVQAALGAFGLGGSVERRRVAEKRRELPLDDAAIRARNPADLALFDTFDVVVHHDGPGEPTTHNPLGYDPAARADALARLAANRADPPHWHEELAGALCLAQQAEAALAWIDAGGEGMAVGDPAAFRPVLERAWEERRAANSPKQNELSAHNAARFRKRGRAAALAAGDAEGLDEGSAGMAGGAKAGGGRKRAARDGAAKPGGAKPGGAKPGDAKAGGAKAGRATARAAAGAATDAPSAASRRGAGRNKAGPVDDTPEARAARRAARAAKRAKAAAAASDA